MLAALGVRVRLAATGRTAKHTITHRAIVAEVWAGAATRLAAPEPGRARWVRPARPGVPLTALGRRLLRDV